MTDLPAGWEWTTLGELLERIEAGRSFGAASRPARDDEWGIIRVSAMTWGEFRAEENKAVLSGATINSDHEIHSGDVLVSRANTADYVGAPVLVGATRPKLLLSDKSLRLVVSDFVDRRWLVYILSSPDVRRQISDRATGTKDSMRNIPQSKLREVRIPLPPLCEQRRIVSSLEEHISKLDAGVAGLDAALRRTRSLVKHVLIAALPSSAPGSWTMTTVGQAGRVSLGRQRHPDWHSGIHMRPYLRVANVFEDKIDASDLMQMNLPPDVFDKFRLSPGDILLNEGQSPEYLGRPAMYRGEPPKVAFTNSLIRFRAGPGVDPEWALLVFRRHMHAGRFVKEVRITTNIAHLSAGRFKAVEFPLPPLDEQRRIVSTVKGSLDGVSRFIKDLTLARTRADLLRRSLLFEAFAGRLVRQDPADDPAAVLLAQIRAARGEARSPRDRRAASSP